MGRVYSSEVYLVVSGGRQLVGERETVTETQRQRYRETETETHTQRLTEHRDKVYTTPF